MLTMTNFWVKNKTAIAFWRWKGDRVWRGEGAIAFGFGEMKGDRCWGMGVRSLFGVKCDYYSAICFIECDRTSKGNLQ